MPNIDVIPHYKSSDGQLHTILEDAVRAERIHQVTALLVVRRADIGIPFAHLERLAEVIVQTQPDVEAIFKQEVRPGSTHSMLSSRQPAKIAAAE